MISTKGSNGRARWRAGAMVVLASVLFACTPPTSSIVSLSVTSAPELTAQQIEIVTQACAPSFDVNTGQVAADPNATLVLGGGAYQIPALRRGSERFEATLPAVLPPGNYAVELLLSDGRRAPYVGHLVITPVDAEITAVSSPVSTASLGQQGVPLSVTLSNPSGCSIDGIRVLPQFTRDGQNLGAMFTVQGPGTIHLDPMTSDYVVDFTVGLNAAATPGPVHLSAQAVDGQRSGSGAGCVGQAVIGSVAGDAEWYILAPSQETLSIIDADAEPSQVRAGETFLLLLTVLNDSTVPVTMDSIEISSLPVGIVQLGHVHFQPARIDAGGQATYALTLAAPSTLDTDTTYLLRPIATARTDAGDLVASRSVDYELMVRGR